MTNRRLRLSSGSFGPHAPVLPCSVGGALERRADRFGGFHGGKSFRLFPPEPIHRGPIKSPSGVAPEGLKSLLRSEPSRRVGGGDDGDNNGGLAKGGRDGCCSVEVHVVLTKKVRGAARSRGGNSGRPGQK